MRAGVPTEADVTMRPSASPRIIPMLRNHPPKLQVYGAINQYRATIVGPKVAAEFVLLSVADINGKVKGRICVVAAAKVRPVRTPYSAGPLRRHHRGVPLGPNHGMIGLRPATDRRRIREYRDRHINSGGG